MNDSDATGVILIQCNANKLRVTVTVIKPMDVLVI